MPVSGSRSLRLLFWLGVAVAVAFELANVYFIMPMPGSQRMRSLELAYTLHRARWGVRALAGIAVAVGLWSQWRHGGRRRWTAVGMLPIVAAIVWVTNFRMAADAMFKEPRTLVMAPPESSAVALDRLVVGVEMNGEARAYPLQFIGYHHQVRDVVAGVPVLVSYCTVCRTGRVFSPVVGETVERFRLVGMDHFNAMFEDHSTGSWWRQANGEAVAGPRYGSTLRELSSLQVTLAEWLRLHPRSRIMQADPAFVSEYAKDYAFENGTSRKALTGTDTTSWGEKSWVVGIRLNGASKAFDWNRLRQERVLNDEVGGVPVVVTLALDGVSFYAYERPSVDLTFAVRGDELMAGGESWPVAGRVVGGLRRVLASQEFWHSWRAFNPSTTRAP